VRSIIVSRFARFVPAVFMFLVIAAAPSAATASTSCAGGDRSPAELGGAATRASTLCLINVQRRAEGLRPLRQSSRLRKVALRHSRDMVSHRYFAHNSRSGTRFSARIARAGWMRGRSAWSVGENLAWGSGTRSTPASIVKAWMASPPHRANILQGRFRVIGIGIGHGVPVSSGGAGATYTTDFGS